MIALRSLGLKLHYAAAIAAALIFAGRSSAELAPRAQAGGQNGSSAVLTKWHEAGGTWKSEAGGLIGSVDGTSRGFAIADDAPFAGPQTVEAIVTPRRHIGDSWSASGLCLYAHTANYWRLALVESPDKRMRYAELTLQNDGVGLGERNLAALEPGDPPLDWIWNTPYRLRLTVTPERITGEVFSMDAKRRWHSSYRLAGTALVRSGWPAVGVQGSESQFARISQARAEPGPESDPVRCAELEEKPARSKWLSLPLSRLVVNPNMSNDPPAPASIAPCLPVNAAYYAGDTPIRLPYLWAWQFQDQNGVRPTITAGHAAEFTDRTASQWKAERSTVVFNGSSVRLSVADVPYGSLTTTVSVDLDETPYLMVRIPKSEGQWAIKVNSGSQAVDTVLQVDTTQTGNFLIDLPAKTGWHGKRKFKLILFAIGAKGSTATFSGLRFAGADGHFPRPEVKETVWRPHQIVERAETGDAALKVESAVTMPDEDTVAQRLRVTRASGQSVTLTGQLPSGKPRWDVERNTVIVEGPDFTAVIKVSRKARWVGVFDSILDGVAGVPAQAASADGGAWAVAIDGVKAGDEIVVAARFLRPGRPIGPALALAAESASGEGFQSALARQESAWNERLARVPHPLSFSLHALDPHGVTPEEIRRVYYKAWVFLLSDSLPQMAENGFAYPQICCGKPALWSEGAAHATATSQWESFLAMQLIAYSSPALAWDAFAGQMSLVRADGSLGGEGLPSRHAQTAWVLYSLTGDRERLKSAYAPLKRLLLWKAANPRWIYHNSTPEDQKDSEFVVHALMDMDYARRIAQALSMPEEVRFWQARSAEMAGDYHHWFWDKQGRDYRLYRTSTGKGESPDQPWNLQGLVLPPDILSQQERNSLLRLFRSSVRRDIPFLIPGLAGFPKYNYTLRGLQQYGTEEETTLMIESAVRDTALAAEFSESYTQAFPPSPVGVVPSVFGAAQMVDGVLWHNGIMLGDGLPVLVRVAQARGVCNLRLFGHAIDVIEDDVANRLSMQGTGLSDLALLNSLHSAKSPDGSIFWAGALPAASRVRLEAISTP